MQNGSEGDSEYQRISQEFAAARKKAEEDLEVRKEKRRQEQEVARREKGWEWEYKSAHLLTVGFLGFVILLHVLGIYLFTSGFLLTRYVLPNQSECDVVPTTGAEKPKTGFGDEGCWQPRQFKKAVVILVDALRYDFTVPLGAQRKGSENTVEGPRHFHDAISVLYETAVRQPRNAFLRPFIADPPTTTLQRLKGLTTGTLPTFIDAGSNFAGTAIEEDNLIAQLNRAGKNVVHLGDDTWHALFPGYFDRELTKPFDSFNVWDLHTVDNGVNEHLFPLMHPANSSKWDMLIGHYLGVDHAGHRYGPDHPAMGDKLRQMDGVLRRLIPLVDDDTLLVVMGDHGMDAKGDHGGESDDEIEAALWMYSKKGIFGRPLPTDENKLPPATAKYRQVGQIDLVPTLALLLGLPIPFNNLGSPIPEAFINPVDSSYENLARAHIVTSAQIHRYQDAYQKVQSLEDVATAGMEAQWAGAVDVYDSVMGQKPLNAISWELLAATFQGYETETLDVCKSLWASFNVPAMVAGISILLATWLVVVTYARGLLMEKAEVSAPLLARGSVGLAVGSALGWTGSKVYESGPLSQSIVVGSAFGAVLGLLGGLLRLKAYMSSPLPTSLLGSAAALFPLLLSIGFAANSWTIWEDRELLFFINTIGVLLLVASLRQPQAKDRIRGFTSSVQFLVCTRIAALSRLCREEQMPYCVSTYYASATSSTSAIWQLAIPFTVALLLPAVIRSYYTASRSYHHSAVLWYGFIFRAALVLNAVYWTLDSADDGVWFGGWGGSEPNAPQSGLLKTIRVIVAQIVLSTAFGAGYSTFVWTPPLIKIESISPSQIPPSHPAAAAAAEAPTEDEPKPKTAIAIFGFGNVYGSHYFLLVTIWALACILVSKPMGGGALALLLWSILALVETLDTCNLLTHSSSPSSASPAPTNKVNSSSPSGSAIGPVALALLGLLHFFTTGHQAALSSIQWDAAFIPLHSIRYPWSPILILLNTFAGPILAALAVPLLALWKRPVAQRAAPDAPIPTSNSQLSPSSTSSSKTQHKRLISDVATAAATFLAVYALMGLATAAWAGWLRRHLMLFRIFSPRFMLGALQLLVVDVVVVALAVGAGVWVVVAGAAAGWGW